MKNKKTFILIIAGLVIIGLLGFLVTIFGNVDVRRIQPSEAVVLRASNPVVPGVPHTIQWLVEKDSVTNRQIELRLRTVAVDQVLTRAELYDESASVVLPCLENDREGSLNVIETTTGELLAWSQVQLLPPGPDCFSASGI